MTLLTYIPNVSQDPHFQPDRRPTFRDSFADAPPELPDELSEAKRYAEHLLTELDEMRNEAAASDPAELSARVSALIGGIKAQFPAKYAVSISRDTCWWDYGSGNGVEAKGDKWQCYLSNGEAAEKNWVRESGHGPTPEAAVAEALPRFKRALRVAELVAMAEAEVPALPVQPAEWTGRIVAGEGAVAL